MALTHSTRHHPDIKRKVQPDAKEVASQQSSTDPISGSSSDTLERTAETKM